MAALLVKFHSSTRIQQPSPCLLNPIPKRLSSLRIPLFPVAALQQQVVAPERKGGAVEKKPEICTADELHYVEVPNSDWRVALWRYLPSPDAPKRNHPLLLLSGIGINAIGLDLSPENSLARYMAGEGYDTWTLELRGVGLSSCCTLLKSSTTDSDQLLKQMMMMGFGFAFPPLISSSFNFINNGFGYPLPQGIVKKQLDEMLKYSWDFQNHLEEDLPAAMEYIRRRSKTKDGKLAAIGHSMGGILLYATVAGYCSQGRDPGLASLTTLGSSLQYSSSRTPLKMLLPLVAGARGLDIPAITSETLTNLTHPFGTNHFSQALIWLITQISAQHTSTQSDLCEKMLNMLCLLPSKLYLQLATTMEDHGLCNRDRTLFYKDHLHKTKVPILAVAGDQDTICPPEAVYETAKHIPENLINYKVFGDSGGPHYDHYDIVGGHLAKDRVYPYIVDFLNHHDLISLD